MSQQEVLDNLKHIELSEAEMNEAIILAKLKKEDKLKEDERKAREDENRRMLFQDQWGFEQTKGYMTYRAEKVLGFPFELDDHNKPIFEMLCYYFSNDRLFVSTATNAGLKNPSLEKGIMLLGNFGVGKTAFMKLFSSNQRQPFRVAGAKYIANLFESDGQDAIEEFNKNYKNAINAADCFYKKESGLCIDDLGTEDIKMNFGNRKNVIGDIIENRYNLKTIGVFFHATTNLTVQQLNDFYGGRVISRMREIMNFIELPGKDRRK